MDTERTFEEKEILFKERTGKSFVHFYDKYYQKLKYYTNKMINDPQKAEDISTESFIVALDKIDKYEKEKAQFSTWLFTIAKNLTLQELKNNRKNISIDVEMDEDGTTMKDFIQDEDTNEEVKHDVITRKASLMLEAISHLKEPYKKVIEMREIKKMPYKDISDTLGKNLSTIKSQIRNGRGLLIKHTAKDFKILDEMYL